MTEPTKPKEEAPTGQILLVGIICSVLILRGWVLMVLWGWIVMPSLHAPALTLPQAIGVTLVLQFVRNEEPGSGKLTAEQVNLALLIPLLFLAAGWVVTLWM